MADKKQLTTEEILALARKQAAGGSSSGGDAGASEAPASETPAPEAPAAEQPAETPPAESKPSTAPKSTADILAAARAQKAGGGGEAKKPAAAPKSTADILAAARAQKGGGGAPAAQAEGGKPKAAPSRPAAAAASGERPPLKEMVSAVKQAQAGKAPPKVPSRAAPPKPKLPKKEPITRRSFFGALASITITPFALAWAAMGTIGVLWLLATARYMMPNMVLELPSKFKIGPPSDYPPGTVSEKYKASRGVWVVNTDQYDGRGMIYALLSICTHLGCTPNWLEGEQKFKCPCHGSGFYITGINFEGPAPRPLERVGIRVAEDGMLEVDKSVMFQEELGQWADPSSYVEVA
jgi:cytochrome b6-f complex iron-sulfur subunit